MPAGPFASSTSAPAAPPPARPAVMGRQASGTSAPPLAPPTPDSRWQGPALLAAVVALHGLGLAWLLRRAEPLPVTPPQAAPIVVSMLPAERPAVRPPAPQPASQAVPQAPNPMPAAPQPRPAPAQRAAAPAQRPAVAAQPVADAPTAISEAPASPASPPAPSAAAGPAEAAAPPSSPRFDAAYLHNQTPYPPMARRLRESGTVRLRVLVSAEGLPEKVELVASSGSPRLDDGAQQAVWRWRFIPARQGDQPVASYVVVPIIYKLEES